MVRRQILISRLVPIFAAVFIFLAGTLAGTESKANPLLLRRSVFKIETTSQDRNFMNPWRLAAPESSTGTGFYIGDGRILTNAHVVSNASYITVQRDSDSRQVQAWVEFMGHDVDLAILTVKDQSYFDGVDPLRFSSVPRLRSPVSTVGFPLGGDQISITDGIVSRISYRSYVHTGTHKHLLIQVDSAINPGNSGGPVFQGRSVVGVAFQTLTRAENTGYIIPTPVVQRFLADISDGTYDGVLDFGIETTDHLLNNPSMAKYFQVKTGSGVGVLVTRVYGWSPLADVLKVNDILLSIQDKEIGFDGRVQFEGERVDFEVLYDLRQRGDQLRFKVLREGAVLELATTAKSAKPRPYMGHIYAKRPRYFVFGGIVFTALSRGVMELWGSDWSRKAPLQLRHLFANPFMYDDTSNREEIVVISDILAHKSTSQLEIGRSIVVDQLDGIKVLNLKTLFQSLTQSKANVARIDFLDDDNPWFLDLPEVKKSHEEILKRYHVSPDKWLESISVDGAVTKDGVP